VSHQLLPLVFQRETQGHAIPNDHSYSGSVFVPIGTGGTVNIIFFATDFYRRTNALPYHDTPQNSFPDRSRAAAIIVAATAVDHTAGRGADTYRSMVAPLPMSALGGFKCRCAVIIPAHPSKANRQICAEN